MRGLADLSNFGGDSVGWPPDLLCWLPVYEWAKMRPVYSLIVGPTGRPPINILHKINIVAFFM